MKIIFILLFIIISPVLSAQNDANRIVDEMNNSPQDSNLGYNLEFEFTGEVTNQLDSAFIIYCVINKQYLINKKELIIKTYKHKDSTETNIIRKNMVEIEKDNISTEDNNIKIELGKASPELSKIEVFVVESDGKITQLMNKNEYSNTIKNEND